jgi:uncharacterized protein GlcG (DUF336 family)
MEAAGHDRKLVFLRDLDGIQVKISFCVRGNVSKGDGMNPQPLTRRKISMELAEALADEAVRASLAMNRNTVVAVCDEGAVLKAFRRPDFSNLGCVDLAIVKARSAVKFNTATHVWEGPVGTQIALSALDGVTVEGGGVPIRINGELIGGIGVSGAQHWQEDVDIIAVAFKKLGIDPPSNSYEAPRPVTKGKATSRGKARRGSSRA